MILFVSIGSLCYGYTANVISSTLAQPTFISYFNLDTRPNATALLSATNGIFQTGGVLGTLTLFVNVQLQSRDMVANGESVDHGGAINSAGKAG